MTFNRILSVALLPLLVTACQKQPESELEIVELALENDAQVYSYGVGYQIGSQMAASPMPMDGDSLMAGLEDALGGSDPRVEQERLQEVGQRLQAKMQEEQQAMNSELSAENSEAAMAFLAENATGENVVTLESGLQYRIIETAEGEKPKADDSVVVNYRGTLIDGTEFDSSYKRGEPARFPVKAVIPGWQEALQLMSVGSKWEVFIPPELAYGEGGQGPIPPGSALIFEVEVMEIVPET